MEERPANTLIYATSNRRHLLPEPLRRVSHEEIHPEEAVSDTLSLSDRFGLHLGFYPFNQATFFAIVEQYARLAALGVTQEELQNEARKWALQRGQFSGCAARQFVDDLSGRIRMQSLKS